MTAVDQLMLLGLGRLLLLAIDTNSEVVFILSPVASSFATATLISSTAVFNSTIAITLLLLNTSAIIDTAATICARSITSSGIYYCG